MRVMGSHAMSTRFLDPGCPSADACWGIVDVMVAASLTCRVSPNGPGVRAPRDGVGGAVYQVRVAPVVSSGPGARQCGSLSRVRSVILRRLRMAVP